MMSQPSSLFFYFNLNCYFSLLAVNLKLKIIYYFLYFTTVVKPYQLCIFVKHIYFTPINYILLLLIPYSLIV
ncbi:hypothetical protein CBDKU1_09200 [Clostridium butyricum DKU-01]|nr:hypothetical protein CBDKU1_09200 [Clostridium butyricum DKU-01]